MSKVQIENFEKKQFKPFRLIIDIETMDEFQTMLGLMNTCVSDIEEGIEQVISQEFRTKSVNVKLNDDIYRILFNKLTEFGIE